RYARTHVEDKTASQTQRAGVVSRQLSSGEGDAAAQGRVECATTAGRRGIRGRRVKGKFGTRGNPPVQAKEIGGPQGAGQFTVTHRWRPTLCIASPPGQKYPGRGQPVARGQLVLDATSPSVGRLLGIVSFWQTDRLISRPHNNRKTGQQILGVP
ncbi:hypothetical protein ACHAXT_002082, partial [Thalassiosira profunda]